MRKQSAKRKQARTLLGIFWIIIIGLAIWQLSRPMEETASTVVPGAATGSQLLNDVGSGQALQGSDLPLNIESPQETAKPN